MTATILAVTLAVGAHGDPSTPAALDQLVKRLQQLDRVGVRRELDALAKTDPDLLYQLSRLDLEWSPYACALRAEAMSAKEAVAYCDTLPRAEAKWAAVFWTLSFRDRQDVIGYVRSVAKVRSPTQRARAYLVCERSGWTDLLDLAEADRDSKESAGLPCSDESKTKLGHYATAYIKKCQPRPSDK